MPPLEPPVSDVPISPLKIHAPLVYGIAATLFLVLSAGAFFVYQTFWASRLVHNTSGGSMVPARALTPVGTILLTLFPKDGTQGGIYQYSFADNALTPYVTGDTDGYITASYKGDTNTILLATNAKVSDGLKNKVPLFQIAEYQKDTNTLTELTNTNLLYKRHPQWSESLNLLVYSARKDQSAMLGRTEDFFVYTRDNNGFEQQIATGSLPVLTPDGKGVVVLKRDGLALVDLTTQAVQTIIPAAGNMWMNAQFTISPKGSYIAWSNPSKGGILVMKVESWAPFKATPLQEIQAYGFWPVFSPNEEYLAYEEFDSEGGVALRPRLVLQDMQTPTRRTIQDLGAFDQMKMFVTDWK